MNHELLIIVNSLIHARIDIKDELCRLVNNTRASGTVTKCINVSCRYCPIYTFSDLNKNYLAKIVHTNQHLRVISIGNPILMSR